ncbi:hypothetical protein [Micrococcus sp.]|uniref:hypothetical protein n=1 Tax=Micrococcus sp. TaxID=1271 RepID=UPI002A915B40|nr:hypothetical protein [Micrococcus sp.]
MDTLITAEVTASVGAVGDSYDKALASDGEQPLQGRTIRSERVWESTEEIELATMG